MTKLHESLEIRRPPPHQRPVVGSLVFLACVAFAGSGSLRPLSLFAQIASTPAAGAPSSGTLPAGASSPTSAPALPALDAVAQTGASAGGAASAARGEASGGGNEKSNRTTGEPARRDSDSKLPENSAAVPEVVSPAERVARLRRAIESDTERLEELRSNVLSGNGEYARSEEEFKSLDRRLLELKMRLTQARDANDETTATQLDVMLTETQAGWQVAKRRFEKAIAERKTANETIQNLEEKVRVERETLDKLLGAAPTLPMKESAGAIDRPNVPPSGAEGLAARTASPAAPLPAVPHTSGQDLLASVTGNPLGTTLAPPAPGNNLANPPSVPKPTTPSSRALQEAAVVAQQTTVAAQKAEEEVRSINERIDLLRRNIESERKLRDAAQQRFDESDAAIRLLSDEMQSAISGGKDPTEIGRRLQEAEQRNREARAEHWRTSIHLDELQTEFGRLQSERIGALEEAQQRWEAADAAQRRVESLSNPFTPENLWHWLVTHGLRVVGILVVMVAILWVSRVLGRRMIQFMMVRGLSGSEQEQTNRANTLAAVLHNAVNVATFMIGVVTILNEVGVPVGPVMGGAAVLGLAVAFGAQSLIKDYFTGFMLLLEQQYFINDVVQIGEVSGQVEQITLRMTMLRDQEGKAHFIPHGTIVSVTNMTYNWSRAVFDITIGYGEDVDEVIDELVRLAHELRQDPNYSRLILEDAAMLGVDDLGESGVRVKFLIKTRPLQQWVIKRELLRRIKNRFDELGIEVPFPQRTLHIRDHRPSSPRGISDDSSQDDRDEPLDAAAA